MLVLDNCAFISWDTNNKIDYGDFQLNNLFERVSVRDYCLGIAKVLNTGGYIYLITNAPINGWGDISWLSQSLFHMPYKLHELQKQNTVLNGNIAVYDILKSIHFEKSNNSSLNFGFLFINQNNVNQFNNLCSLEFKNKVIELDWWDILKHFWHSLYPYIYNINYIQDELNNFKLITPLQAYQSRNIYPLWRYDLSYENWFEQVFRNANLIFTTEIGEIVFRHYDENQINKFYQSNSSGMKMSVEFLNYFNKWDNNTVKNELWIEIDKDFPLNIWQSLLKYFEFKTT